MKALKPVLAIALPVILVLGWVLWQDHSREAAPTTATAVMESSTPAPASPDALVPMNEVQLTHKLAAPSSDSFRPAVRATSQLLPPNPYAAVPWDARLPFRRSHMDRGLYILPVGQKVQH